MTGLEVGLGIAAVFGGGAQVYGQIKGASAQADAAERGAALKRLQAQELLSRENVNEGIIRENSLKLQDQYELAFAATGNAGTGLGGLIQMKKQTEQNIANSRRDAEFKAFMLNQGADIESQLASDALAASYITGAGTIIGLGAKFGGIYGNFTKVKDLSKAPVLGSP